MKTAEYRTRPTRVMGERFHIYVPLRAAAPAWDDGPPPFADDDLRRFEVDIPDAEAAGGVRGPKTHPPRARGGAGAGAAGWLSFPGCRLRRSSSPARKHTRSRKAG